MYLTLEVVSPQAASLGADRRRTVGPAGLTIGRVPGNDWVIPDPYVSKQHARISYANGAFFVESLGRNAIAIGSANNALPGNQRQPLRNGDHLFIDQYEIIVTTMQGDPPGASLANDDPFGVLPASPRSAGSQPSSIPDVWDGGLAGDFGDTGVLDPLAALGGNSRAAQPEPLPPVNWQQASALEDHFEPPRVRDVEAPPPASGIPDNWDRTNLTHRGGAPAVKTPPSVPPSRPVPPARPVTPVRAATPSPGGRVGGRDVPTPRQLIPEPRVVVPESRAPIPEPVVIRQPEPIPTQAAFPARAPVMGDHSGRFEPAFAGFGAELTELMRGAGLSDKDLSPEMVRDLGRVLRVVVEGVMDVLRARAEIKSQFRLPLTRIQSVENNPLKHSPNVESALHTLLVQRNPGYLSAVQAFEDAFADIRSHQMAMLEGVRTAFQSMLESFDPKELEKEFERSGKRGLSFKGAKSKYWDLYVDRFAHLGGDADDTFRRLFGDVFAEAYEKQLERLKTLGRNTGKT
jgi:type VI secretion system FHA domain protein